MNFNATFVIIFIQMLVVIAGLWLFASFQGYLKHLRGRSKQNVSFLAVVFGSFIICATFLINILTNRFIDPHGTYSPSLNEFLTFLGVSAGSFVIIGGLISLLSNSKRLLLGKNISEVSGLSPRFWGRQGQIDTALESDPNHKLKILFEDSPALLLVIDKYQVVLDVNNTFANFLNINSSELKGKQLEDLVFTEDHPLVKNLLSETLAEKNEDYHLDLRLVHQDMETLWVKIIPRMIDYDEHKGSVLLLVQDNRESKNLAELIAFHSQYDELTMLHNREGLENYLAQVLDISHENRSRVGLIYIDVDQLKVVNDTCGHAAGDRLLQYLVTVIGDASQECSFFARVGGDEFALVKLNSSEEEAYSIAESVRSAAEDFTFVWRTQNYRQSISVGVAINSDAINDVVDLIGAADSACYTAKENGKNRVVIYSESIAESQDNRRDMMWVSRLQKAIQDGEFVLYFHPIQKLNTLTKAHIHYEMLIRYVDEEGHHVLPQHFLPAVERFGLSEQIDLWVLTTALDYLDKHPQHTEILDCCSINLTSQSISNHRIRSAILQVVQSYEFPREKICFEITESSAIHNLNEAQEFVDELKTLGCKLALDDFGTGFSSFGYLKHLDVDYIKIDGSFVRDIITDRFDRAMVSAINNIGKEMDIEIIAEYAENSNILRTLQQMRVDYAQGHAIAKPLPIYKLESYYPNPK